MRNSDRAPYDTIKLINYDRNPAKRHVLIEDDVASLETPLEKMGIPSWGVLGKVGDIIVVVRGSSDIMRIWLSRHPSSNWLEA